MTLSFGNLDDAAAEVASVRMELEEARSLYENAKTQTVSEVQALTNQVMVRLDAVEARLTARETAHTAILEQQTELIQQLTAKLQGVLEVKPEIMPYEYELAKGVLDQVTGYRLRADATAQRKFTGQLLMVFVLVSTGQIPSDHPIGFWTHDGVRHELPASEYIGMVIRYGMGISAIEEQF